MTTNELHCTLTEFYYDIIDRNRISRENDVTIVVALNSPTYTLIACLLLCEVSQKSIRKISRYLGICKGLYLPVCVNYFPIKVFYFLDVSGKFLPLIVLTIVITVEC